MTRTHRGIDESMSPTALSRTAGFTLIELVLVVGIIAVLAAIAVPTYVSYVEKARVVRAIVEMEQIAAAVDAYKREYGSPPPDLDSIDEHPRVDPWGSPYAYLKIAGSTPFTDTSPLRPHFALASSPPRVILTAGPPGGGNGNGGGNGGGNVMGEVRKDRFLVPLNSDYDLYSKGKDGESVPQIGDRRSQDDVLRANNGAYIGLASGY
jgi:general secretion pathway protein G